jgi:hypothetical protein
MKKIPQQFEQLELDGILSKNDEKKVVEKLKNGETNSTSVDEHKRVKTTDSKAPFKKIRPGYGFVESLRKKAFDPKWQEEQLEKFRKINERKDLL